MRRLLLLSLLALAAAGCGGGGGERLSREEFARQANEVCQGFDREIEALGAPQSLDDVEGFADRSAEIARDGRDELRNLEPPEELNEEYDELLETLDKEIDDIERLGDAAADDDEEEVRKIVDEGAARSEASDRLARELGLSACAEN